MGFVEILKLNCHNAPGDSGIIALRPVPLGGLGGARGGLRVMKEVFSSAEK